MAVAYSSARLETTAATRRLCLAALARTDHVATATLDSRRELSKHLQEMDEALKCLGEALKLQEPTGNMVQPLRQAHAGIDAACHLAFAGVNGPLFLSIPAPGAVITKYFS